MNYFNKCLIWYFIYTNGLTHSFLQRQFFAPKLIILMKCLIDILFFSIVLMFLYVEQDVNLA